MSTTTCRRIFVGDVHGHYEGLMKLLEAIAPDSQDQVYFVGDLIDRGPQSARVIDFVRHNRYHCVLGNHEQLLLESFPGGEVRMATLQNWLYSGGQTTLASYRDTETLLDHLDWIRGLPIYLDLGDIWLVHAGVHPELPLPEQTTQEFCWIRDLFHSSTQPYFSDKLIITGHTITFTLPQVEPGQIARGQGWLDIDTGAYHPKSGWLTAIDIDNAQAYQFNVFQQSLRVRPFAEAVTTVEPGRVIVRQRTPIKL